MNNQRFDDIPFAEYDTTPGTERFADGWYDGFVREVKNAGEKEGRRQIKIVVDLDQMPTVQRTMGIAWGTKDGAPAAWVAFLSAIVRKPIGDPALRAATPKDIRGRRAAFKLEWSSRGYMNIVAFAEDGSGGARRPFQQQQQPVPAAEPQRHRVEASPASVGAAHSDTTDSNSITTPTHGTVAPLPAYLRERYSPGQLRILIIGNSIGMNAEAVLEFVQTNYNCALEQIPDAQVAAITNALRGEQPLRTAS